MTDNIQRIVASQNQRVLRTLQVRGPMTDQQLRALNVIPSPSLHPCLHRLRRAGNIALVNDRWSVNMYRLIAPTRAGLYPTVAAAPLAMLWAGQDDPQVTCMPYIDRADGSPLTTTENDLVDSIMDTIDYDSLPPCPQPTGD